MTDQIEELREDLEAADKVGLVRKSIKDAARRDLARMEAERDGKPKGCMHSTNNCCDECAGDPNITRNIATDRDGKATDKEGLLPCPFCGRKPVESFRADGQTGHTGIFFASCMCGGHSAKVHQHGANKEELRSRWNTRTAPPSPADHRGDTMCCPFCGAECDMDDVSVKGPTGREPCFTIDCPTPDCFLHQFARGSRLRFESADECVNAFQRRASSAPVLPAGMDEFRINQAENALIDIQPVLENPNDAFTRTWFELFHATVKIALERLAVTPQPSSTPQTMYAVKGPDGKIRRRYFSEYEAKAVAKHWGEGYTVVPVAVQEIAPSAQEDERRSVGPLFGWRLSQSCF